MAKENKGIEFQFVESWEGWDELDNLCLQFYDCTLKPHIAALVGFSKASVVIVSCDACSVQFMETEDSEPVEFNFEVNII